MNHVDYCFWAVSFGQSLLEAALVLIPPSLATGSGFMCNVPPLVARLVLIFAQMISRVGKPFA